MKGNDVSRDKNWIGSFSGLRFIVILLLILHHWDAFNGLNFTGKEHWEFMMKYFSEGFLSVDFFFVLSGFVIYYGYGKRLRENLISGKKFLLYRLAHLFPLYCLCLFIATFVNYGTKVGFGLIFGKDFFVHLFMLQSWIPQNLYAFQFNALGWAVSTELFFYVFFTVVRNLRRNDFFYLTIALWIGIIFIAVVKGTTFDNANWFYYINPGIRLNEFLLGVVLGICCEQKSDFFKNIPQNVASLFEILSIGILIVSVFISANFNIGWQYKWGIYYAMPVSIVVLAFSINKGFISEWLSQPYMQYLGALAFPIYLTHQICLVLVKSLVDEWLVSFQNVLICAILGTILSILLSIFLLKYFTKPLNKAIRNIVDKCIDKRRLS